MAMLPRKSWLNVKKIKHQRTFKIPLIIKRIIIFLGSFSLFAQMLKTIANVRYITVQTIGITMFGIHSLGFSRLINHSMPRLTNIEPRTATIIIDNHIKIICNVLFLILYFILISIKKFQISQFWLRDFLFLWYHKIMSEFYREIYKLKNLIRKGWILGGIGSKNDR